MIAGKVQQKSPVTGLDPNEKKVGEKDDQVLL
jgi:hypothetical protein